MASASEVLTSLSRVNIGSLKCLVVQLSLILHMPEVPTVVGGFDRSVCVNVAVHNVVRRLGSKLIIFCSRRKKHVVLKNNRVGIFLKNGCLGRFGKFDEKKSSGGNCPR